MNYFCKPLSEDIAHVYASELSIDEMILFLQNNSQRSLLNYVPPSHPIFRVGTLTRMMNGQWLAERFKVKKSGRLEAWGIYDCEAFLAETVLTPESIVDLSPRRRGRANA